MAYISYPAETMKWTEAVTGLLVLRTDHGRSFPARACSLGCTVVEAPGGRDDRPASSRLNLG